jgi:hypothetical protein
MESKPTAAGREHGQLRTGTEQIGEWRGVGRDTIDVVHHEQCALLADQQFEPTQ